MAEASVTPQEYWNLRAPTYGIVDTFGRKIIKAFLEKMPKPRSVVDIGTGKGELLHLFADVPRVVGLDFSEEMMAFARRRIARHGWANVSLQHMDLTKGHLDERFDLLVGRTVLMHIPPVDIAKAADNVAAMSDTLVLLELWDNEPGQDYAGHNWVHDYHGLFESRGFKVVEAYRRPDVPQVLFVFERKR